MVIARDDRWVADALGRALAGAQVYWCLQPATVPSAAPPSPLATVYSDTSGDSATNPQLTDGFGHAVGYLDEAVLYTVAIYHPLFGSSPIVLPDQSVGGPGDGGANVPVQASTTQGTITGSGVTWTLPSVPVANSLILQRNGQVLTPTLTYTLSGAVITLTSSLNPSTENLNANYLTALT